jgi:hypothetical protein
MVLIAETTGVRERFLWLDGWSVFFTGAGTIVLFEALLRALVPGTRGLLAWNLIGGAVLLSLGLGDEFGWAFVGAVVLGTVGLLTLAGTLERRK